MCIKDIHLAHKGKAYRRDMHVPYFVAEYPTGDNQYARNDKKRKQPRIRARIISYHPCADESQNSQIRTYFTQEVFHRTNKINEYGGL